MNISSCQAFAIQRRAREGSSGKPRPSVPLVIASVDNLRFAEAVNRLDLEATKNSATLEDLQRGGAKEKTKGAVEGAEEGASSVYADMKTKVKHH